MSDQAEGLRLMIRGRPEPMQAAPAVAEREPGTRRPRTMVFCGGKGGAGTSNLVLNLAIALGQARRRVVLVDADWGAANLDVLCGLFPARDLGDALSEDRPFAETIHPGPAGIHLLPGAHGLRTAVEDLLHGPARLASELAEDPGQADYVLIDAGGGLHADLESLAAIAEDVVLVTTPEPTALADAQTVLQRFGRRGRFEGEGPSLNVVVNQAETVGEAREGLTRITEASREFLGLAVRPLGYVRWDRRVRRAVRRREPFLLGFPRSPAARDVRRLAHTLGRQEQPAGRRFDLARALVGRLAPARRME